MLPRIRSLTIIVAASSVAWFVYSFVVDQGPAAPEAALQLHRVVQSDVEQSGDDLRGLPGSTVEVAYEMRNVSRETITLSPLAMACSCQISRKPELVIPPRQRTTFLLQLRYPPVGAAAFPVVIRSVTGDVLVNESITLHAEQDVPYVIHEPDLVQIVHLDGVDSCDWNTSLTTIESIDAPHFLHSATLPDGSTSG